MKAWIENEKVRDICAGNPFELFHPNIAGHYDTDVPENAENGDGWVNGQLVKPIPVEPVIEPKAVINFVYPIAAAKATQIMVDVSVVDEATGSALPLTRTYYVPLVDAMTNILNQMLIVNLVNGVGQVSFTVATAGVYSINVDFIRPQPTATLSETPDIVVY